MKRVVPSSRQDAGKTKKPKMSFKHEPTQLRPFVFENLPGGVRNQIYELVASNEITSLSKTGDKLTSNSGLLLSSRRISREFASMLDSSPEINVTIDHFQFTKLINFINTRTKTSFDRITSAILNIKLVVYGPPDDWEIQDPDLVRWATFIRQMRSNGLVLFAEYSGEGDNGETLGEWAEALNTCWRRQRSKEARGHLIDMQRALNEVEVE